MTLDVGQLFAFSSFCFIKWPRSGHGRFQNTTLYLLLQLTNVSQENLLFCPLSLFGFEFESEHSWALEHGDCRQCNAACTSSSNKQNCKLCIQSNGFTHKKGRRHCTTMVLVVGYIYSRMCVKEALYYMCVHLGNLANNKKSSENMCKKSKSNWQIPQPSKEHYISCLPLI